MSRDRVRLRLTGEPDEVTGALAIADESARALLPAPTIALVGAHERVDVALFARALALAAAELGVSRVVWRAILRASEGAQQIEAEEETLVRGSAAAMGAALDTLIDTAPKVDVRIAIGLPFVALRRPSLAILQTAGTTPVQWDPAVRGLRDRFELVVAEPSPGLARELLLRLTRGAAAAT